MSQLSHDQVRRLFFDCLENSEIATSQEFSEALALLPENPRGFYTCGCPWHGRVIPHFCPYHPGAHVIFEIREAQS